jgi:hypothetical protein
MFSFLSSPSVLLRIEGAVVLALSMFLYGRVTDNWLMFAVLLLAPDLSMLGYLAGVRVGAAVYNLIHVYTLPGALAVYGLLASNPFAVSLSLIWLAHIGADRLLGFGLKYPTVFKDTHLSHV